MAQALVVTNGVSGQGRGFAVLLTVIYNGEDMDGQAQSGDTYAAVDGAADADAVRAVLVDAVIADAAARGITVAAGDITLPVFQRG